MMYFLKTKSIQFIAWICPLLQPYVIQEKEYIFYQGDEILSMFFMKEGSCGFVLPNFKNIKYVNINIGCDFGMECIVNGIMKCENPKEWIKYKANFIR